MINFGFENFKGLNLSNNLMINGQIIFYLKLNKSKLED